MATLDEILKTTKQPGGWLVIVAVSVGAFAMQHGAQMLDGVGSLGTWLAVNITLTNSALLGFGAVAYSNVRNYRVYVEEELAECRHKHELAEGEIEELRQKISRRDLVVAALYFQAAQKSGGRRSRMVPMNELIGDDMDESVKRAETLFDKLKEEKARENHG